MHWSVYVRTLLEAAANNIQKKYLTLEVVGVSQRLKDAKDDIWKCDDERKKLGEFFLLKDDFLTL